MENKNINPALELEVIATKDDKHYISYMSLNEWSTFLKTKAKAGFKYQAFQKGFSQYKLENETR